MSVTVFDSKTIEICKLTDYDTLLRVKDLWADLIKEVYPDKPAKPMLWLVQTEERLHDPRIYKIYLVNTLELGIVGFADALYVLNPIEGRLEVHVQYVYIKPEFRHTGTLRRLYTAIAEEAKNNKINHMIGYCSPGLEKFWTDFGFTMTIKQMEKSLKD